MHKVAFAATSLFLTVLLLSSCGGAPPGPMAEGQAMDGQSARGPVKAIPSEASLNFTLAAGQPNAQRTFGGTHLKECRLAKDPAQNQIYFSTEFQDPTAKSALKVKVMTRLSDVGSAPIKDSQIILGADEMEMIRVGLGEQTFSNGQVEPNSGPPVQSSCNLKFTLADSFIQGTLFCTNLLNEAGEMSSGTIKFTCAVGQLPVAAAVKKLESN